MLKLTEEYINSTAPNQNAILNGWGLVKKNSFIKYNTSDDEKLIFGECKGSGAGNYLTSVDFINPESPVFRCTCPSRQFPCKHALGLMYAYVNGKKFSRADIPPDIADKRQRSEKREEKNKDKDSVEPRKVNKNALLKKMETQKDGLELLEKITYKIAQAGLGTINAKTLQLLEDQAKQLGNHYIPGAQIALRELIVFLKNAEDPEMIYTEAVDHMTRLYTLCKKGREYLEKRLKNPEMSYDVESTLDEWLGHAWQLSELGELGRVKNEAELVQISFNSYTDEARQEFVDMGAWLDLAGGNIYETRNYRPFKAAKYIREDDSFYSVIQPKELFIYPGDMNPRIRWENMTARSLTGSDITAVRSFACKSFQETVKKVKNQIKNPLSAKYPLVLLEYKKIGIIDDRYVMEDNDGQRIVLADIPGGFEPPAVNMLKLLEGDNLQDQVMLVRFWNDMDAKRLYAKPLSIVNNDEIIRLVY